MKKFILIVLVLLMFHTGNYAQSYGVKDKFSFGWEVGIPSNDFVSNTSYAGGRLEYQRMVKPNLSIGLAASWNSFQQYVPKSTYQKPDGTGAITTDIVRELYSLPLTLNMKYSFQGGTKITPYAGLGLGGQYSDQNIYFNIYGIEDNNWGFVMRPELGLTYGLNNHGALYLSATYNYATNKSDVFNNDNLNHVALSLGYVFSQ